MRVSNWESKLATYLDECRNKIFIYGEDAKDGKTFDCCSFSIGAEKVMYGKTQFPEYVDAYKSLKEGKALLKKLGYRNWITAVDKKLIKINPKLAQRGDLVSYKCKNSFILGICVGKDGVFVGEDYRKSSLVFISMELMKYAWRFD